MNKDQVFNDFLSTLDELSTKVYCKHNSPISTKLLYYFVANSSEQTTEMYEAIFWEIRQPIITIKRCNPYSNLYYQHVTSYLFEYIDHGIILLFRKLPSFLTSVMRKICDLLEIHKNAPISLSRKNAFITLLAIFMAHILIILENMGCDYYYNPETYNLSFNPRKETINMTLDLPLWTLIQNMKNDSDLIKRRYDNYYILLHSK